MNSPSRMTRSFMDSLLAFWPGLQVLWGDVDAAIHTHDMLYHVTERHNFLPEVCVGVVGVSVHSVCGCAGSECGVLGVSVVCVGECGVCGCAGSECGVCGYAGSECGVLGVSVVCVGECGVCGCAGSVECVCVCVCAGMCV